MNLSKNLDLNRGQMPPQNTSAEEAVLGALMMNADDFIRVSDIMSPDMFYKEHYGIIYEAMESLFTDNKPIDMITVTQKLMTMGKLEEVGGGYVVASLTAHVVSGKNVEHHAMVVAECYMRRVLVLESSKLLSKAYDRTLEFDTVLNDAVDIIDRVLEKASNKSRILSFGDNLEVLVETIKERQNNKDKKGELLIPSFSGLRSFVKEYEPSRLILIAGRPGMGKTAFALNEAISFARHGNACLFFSLEMNKEQMTKRAFIAECNLDKRDVDSDNMPAEYWEVIDSAVSKMYDYPLFIDDTPLANFTHIKTKSKIFKKKHDIKCIVIDYLQLMGTDMKMVREQQVSLLTRQLKALSKELDIPVFLLSQLNRNADSRKEDGFKPKLSDLRESGAIEQDIDIALFPYRPEYYFKEDPSIKGRGKILIEKNRDGQTGEADVVISQDVSRWTDEFAEYEIMDEKPNYAFEKEKPF